MSRHLFAIFSIWFTAHTNMAVAAPCTNKSQFAELPSLTHKVALIGEDDRQKRDPNSSDGRLLCVKKKFSSSKKITKDSFSLGSTYVSNASLVFENNIALVNRHNFMDKNGKRTFSIKNCFYEHVQTGEVVPLVEIAHPEHPADGDGASDADEDIALVRLASAPKGGFAIPESEFAIDDGSDVSELVRIDSNFAANMPRGKEASSTSVQCKREVRYATQNDRVTNAYGTRCDTGGGSSGSRVYNSSGKVIGIVEGEVKEVREGQDFDPTKLSTIITQFDESLFETYQKLNRRAQASVRRSPAR